MTTPAVNIDSALNVSIVTQAYRLSNNQPYNTGAATCGMRRRLDIRPASKNGARRPDGWLMPGSWDHEVAQYVLSSGPCRFNGFPNSDTYTIYSNLPILIESPGTYPNVPSSDNLLTRSVTAALLKLKGKGPNLGVLIGERHETARMFINAATAVSQAYRAFRRNNPKDWAKVLKHDVAGTSKWPSSWLAVQYGVKPFVSDVQAAAEFANKLAQVRPPVVTVKGAAKLKYTNQFNADPGTGGFMMKCSDEIDYSAFVRLDYVQSSPLESSLSSLGITNPFLVAWELLPYSFVADWFIQIGDYISTWDAAFGYQFLSGSNTIRFKAKRSGNAQMRPGRSGTANGSISGHYIKLTRRVYTASPLPRTPVFKDPLSYGHVANFASLVVTALQGNWHKK